MTYFSDFKVEWKRPIYQGHTFTLEQRLISHGTELMLRDIVIQKEAVGILPHIIDPNGVHCLMLVEQYRAPLNKKVWEIPAGHVDPGEDFLVAGIRELNEETGIDVNDKNRWSHLIDYQANIGLSNHPMSIWLCKNIPYAEAEDAWAKASPQGLEEEKMGCRIITFHTAMEWIEQDKIIDSKTIIAIMMAARFLTIVL